MGGVFGEFAVLGEYVLVEDVVEQGALAGTRYAAQTNETLQGNVDIQALEIVLSSPFDADPRLRFTATRRVEGSSLRRGIDREFS